MGANIPARQQYQFLPENLPPQALRAILFALQVRLLYFRSFWPYVNTLLQLLIFNDQSVVFCSHFFLHYHGVCAVWNSSAGKNSYSLFAVQASTLHCCLQPFLLLWSVHCELPSVERKCIAIHGRLRIGGNIQ